MADVGFAVRPLMKTATSISSALRKINSQRQSQKTLPIDVGMRVQCPDDLQHALQKGPKVSSSLSE